MGIGRIQLGVVNSRIRQLFQKHYEFRVLKGHLREHGVDLTGSVILDAGCGSGYSSELIIDEFQPAELYAMDILPEQVGRVKQRDLPAKILVGDIADVSLPSGKLDAVFTFGVFHHVPRWPKALREVNRVLAPGGVLLGGELSEENSVGFEWDGFVEDLKAAGFRVAAKERIYLGYFRSFMCVKPDGARG